MCLVDRPVGPETAPRRRATMEAFIARALPGGLLIPTTRRCTTGVQPLLQARAAHIESRFRELGWLLTAADEVEDPWLSVEEIAELLGLSPCRARVAKGTGFDTARSTWKGRTRSACSFPNFPSVPTQSIHPTT